MSPSVAPYPAARELTGSGDRERAGGRRALLALCALCVVSRVVSTIFYIEDTDSLRFALSLQEYSVEKLQPHFPGYPLFWAVAKPLYLAVGSYAVAFSLIGGLATFAIAYFLLRLARYRLESVGGACLAALILFNPLIWLMGNRYMPDLLGLAVTLASFHFLVVEREANASRSLGMLLAGLLAGIRLSYLPFLLVPVLAVLARREDRGRHFAAGTVGVLLWGVPFVWFTGWSDLFAAARRQTVGHFTEFGGTVATEPQAWERLSGLVRGVFADGLGGFWPQRHPLTLLVALGVLLALILGAGHLRKRIQSRERWLMAGSWLTYLLWIGLYQNVIHKSRHVMPLLPFVLVLVAFGCALLWNRRSAVGRVWVEVFLLGYATVTAVLVVQHRRPTAVAQLAAELRQEGVPRVVVSIPLVNFYLQAQGVEARFVSVENPAELAALERRSPEVPITVVGRFPWLFPGEKGERRVLYHNPYVNRMWSEIEVYEYDGSFR